VASAGRCFFFGDIPFCICSVLVKKGGLSDGDAGKVAQFVQGGNMQIEKT
jgi:hypothetical protein